MPRRGIDELLAQIRAKGIEASCRARQEGGQWEAECRTQVPKGECPMFAGTGATEEAAALGAVRMAHFYHVDRGNGKGWAKP